MKIHEPVNSKNEGVSFDDKGDIGFLTAHMVVYEIFLTVKWLCILQQCFNIIGPKDIIQKIIF